MRSTWTTAPPPARNPYRPWLTAPGSLTARLRTCCEELRIQRVFQGLGRPGRDEAGRIGLRPGRLAHVREVILLADGVPVVFAHSIVAPEDLCGPWRAVGKLGTRPLAEALFANPLVERSAIEWRRIDRLHHLHARMARTDLAPGLEHLARRSRFSLAGRPLIVTEVFLPDVLRLSSQTFPPA